MLCVIKENSSQFSHNNVCTRSRKSTYSLQEKKPSNIGINVTRGVKYNKKEMEREKKL